MHTEHQTLLHQILNFAEESGYRSFSIGKFCKFHRHHGNKKKIEKVIKFLCSQNQLIQLGDGRFISSKKMDEIKARISDHIKSNGGLTIQESKVILGQGRNRGIPILDYLDTIGITTRVGNIRVLREDVEGF
ncbi:MAG: SelB C-terminal domain-containing protein [Deltaproteobacteria bacterium]|mgnify:CR=1 FL=1|nr:SelB C-terminal domain-containing protein [Deltaproteobacteria bacterium]MBW2074013.1 SelB C-terminal domain-containing protein [Deltaproteobacteria bacterium]